MEWLYTIKQVMSGISILIKRGNTLMDMDTNVISDCMSGRKVKHINEFNYEASLIDGCIVRGDCSSAYQYIYDKDGRLTNELWEAEMVVIEHEYDEAGREILYRQCAMNGDSDRGTYWCGVEDVTRTAYDERGNAVDVEYIPGREGELAEYFHYANEYDADGRIVKITTGRDEVLQVKKYVYCENGCLGLIMTYDSTGALSCVEEYDNFGNKIAEYHYMPQQELREVSVFRYDNHNNLISKGVRTDMEEFSHSYTYIYDSEGNWIGRETVRIENGDKTYSVSEREIEYW